MPCTPTQLSYTATCIGLKANTGSSRPVIYGLVYEHGVKRAMVIDICLDRNKVAVLEQVAGKESTNVLFLQKIKYVLED